MSNSKRILVTGATGNLGNAVVKALSSKGFKVLAGSTDPEKAKRLLDVDSVKLVYEEIDKADNSFEGISGIFLIAPPMDPEAPSKLIPVIDKAKAAGVNHIVFNSALGVNHSEEAPLRIIEKYLIASGMNYTILRPNFFMENFSTGFAAPMIAAGGIYLASDDAKTSFISTGDIAEVASVAFADEHFGMEYNLTGPEALNHSEVAKIISDNSNKDVKYFPLKEEEMLQSARENGMPEGAVQYMAVLYRAVRADLMSATTEDVKKVTGKKPVSFTEFTRKNQI